jgi:hypothetical protein
MYIASHGMRIVASPTAAVAALRSHRSPQISSKPKAQALTYSCSLCPSLKPFTARPLGRRTLSSASGARFVIMAALTVCPLAFAWPILVLYSIRLRRCVVIHHFKLLTPDPQNVSLCQFQIAISSVFNRNALLDAHQLAAACNCYNSL